MIPSIHVDYKRSRIKQNLKEGVALRTECTINDTRDFGIGKRLPNLPALREVGFPANRRLLEVQRISCDPATERYTVTDFGLAAAVFLTRAHARFTGNGLAEIVGPDPPPRSAPARPHQPRRRTQPSRNPLRPGRLNASATPPPPKTTPVKLDSPTASLTAQAFYIEPGTSPRLEGPFGAVRVWP